MLASSQDRQLASSQDRKFSSSSTFRLVDSSVRSSSTNADTPAHRIAGVSFGPVDAVEEELEDLHKKANDHWIEVYNNTGDNCTENDFSGCNNIPERVLEYWANNDGAGPAAFHSIATAAHTKSDSPADQQDTVSKTVTAAWTDNTGKAVSAGPAVDGQNNRLYVGNLSGNLIAYTLDGQKEWSYTADGAIDGAPTIDSEGNIYFGSQDRRMYSLAPDKTENWTQQLDDWILASPALDSNGNLYIGTVEGTFYSISVSNGSINWQTNLNGKVTSSAAISASGPYVYVGSWDNHLYKINKNTGDTVWSFKTDGKMKASPALDGSGNVYFGSSDQHIYKVDDSGSEVWSYKTEGPIRSSPVLDSEGHVYAGSWDHSLYKLNRTSGDSIWKFTTGDGILSTPLIGDNGRVYFGSRDHHVYAVNQLGTGVWKLETGKPVSTSPNRGDTNASAPGLGFIGSTDGKVYGISVGITNSASSPWPQFQRTRKNSGSAVGTSVAFDTSTIRIGDGVDTLTYDDLTGDSFLRRDTNTAVLSVTSANTVTGFWSQDGNVATTSDTPIQFVNVSGNTWKAHYADNSVNIGDTINVIVIAEDSSGNTALLDRNGSGFRYRVKPEQLLPSINYVNDDSTVGDQFTTATGSDSGQGTYDDPYRTVRFALNQISSGDTIFVDAGSYGETLSIDKNNVALIGADSSATTLSLTEADSANPNNIGIYADTQTNLVIGNIGFRYMYSGIKFHNVDNSWINNVTVQQVADNGIHFSRSSYGLVSNSTIDRTGHYGVLLNKQSDTNTITNNSSFGNSEHGFELVNSDNNALTNNTAYDNGLHGFNLLSSHRNQLMSNTGRNNADYGFHLFNSQQNQLSQNISRNNGSIGFEVESSSNNLLVRNVSANNDGEGFILSSSANRNELRNNESYGNGFSGFYLFQSSDNKLERNTSYNNNEYGFWLNSSSENRLVQNTSDSNVNWEFNVGGLRNSIQKNNIPRTGISPNKGLMNTSSGTHTITRNWWGTTDEFVISSLISDTVNQFTPYRLNPIDTGLQADTIVPAIPQMVSATPSDSDIKVQWQEVTSNEDGSSLNDFSAYRIYRTTSGTESDWKQNATMVATINTASDTNYIDNKVSAGNIYKYRITTLDDASPQKESFLSKTVSAPAGGAVGGGPTWYVNDESTNGDIFTTDAGSDSTGDGTNIAPFGSISKAMSMVNPGDTVKADVGTYGETLTIPVDGLTLIGAGSSSLGTVIDPGDSTAASDLNAIRAVGRSGLRISRLRVQNANDGLELRNSTQSKITSIKTRANGRYGILFSDGRNNQISASVIHSNDSAGVALFGDQTRLNDNIIRDHRTVNSMIGAVTVSGSGHKITENLFKNNIGGLELGSEQVMTQADTPFVERNLFKSNAVGLEIELTNQARITQNEFVNNDTGFLLDDQSGIDDTIAKNNIVQTNNAWVDAPDVGGSDAVLARNYWGSTDRSLLSSSVAGTQSDSVSLAPFRLGFVDTGANADTIAPATPVVDTAIASGETAVIGWQEVTSDEDGSSIDDFLEYRIYRDTDPTESDWKNESEFVGTIFDKSTTTFTDQSIDSGTTYYYRVTAVDNFNLDGGDGTADFENESFFSDTVSANPGTADSGTSTWYVNDNNTSGDVFSTAAGSDTNGDGTSSSPFGSISKAISNTSSGDTVKADVGTYGETVVVDTNGLSLVGVDSSATKLALSSGDSTSSGNIGIKSSSVSGVTIKDMGFQNMSRGIKITGGQEHRVRRVKINQSGTNGLELDSLSNAYVEQIDVEKNLRYGLNLINVDKSTFKTVNAHNNGNNGVYLSRSDTNLLEDVTSANNKNLGIDIFGSSSNDLKRVETYSNGDNGIRIWGSTFSPAKRNVIKNSRSHGNENIGVSITEPSNKVTKTVSKKNSAFGFLISESNNKIIDNRSIANDSSGFRLSTSNARYNKLKNNLSYNNSRQGFHLGFNAGKNILRLNTADSNARWAFYTGDANSGLIIRNEKIQKNNILRTGITPDSGLFAEGGTQQDITNNWWNTTDEETIADMIDAFHDTIPYRLGKVDTAPGADTIAPADPVVDMAGSLSSDTVVVRWQEVTENEDTSVLMDFNEYRIYRDTNPQETDWKNNSTLVGTKNNSSDTFFRDTTVNSGTTYYYRVTAADDPGIDGGDGTADFENESFFSDTVQATPQTPSLSIDTMSLTVADSNDTLTYSQLGGGQNLHESEDHKFQVLATKADTVKVFYRRDGVTASTSDSSIELSVKSSTTFGDIWSGTLTDAQYEPGDTISFVVFARSISGDTILQDRMGQSYEYTARNDSFTMAIEPMGTDTGVYRSSIQWGDYDNDGDLDLAVSGQDNNVNTRLIVHRNDGSASFTNVAEPLGPNEGLQDASIQWGDYDSDGDLDLAATGEDKNFNERLIVFRNDGGGVFTNVAEPMGTDVGVHKSSIQWGDYDNDGDLDLAVSGIDNSSNERLIIFRNDGGGVFTNVAEPMGTNNGVRGRTSIQWGDYDNDGDLDLAVSGIDNSSNRRLIVFRNDGNGNFTNVAEPMGSNAGVWESSIQWGDYDSDGDLDLAVSGSDNSGDERLIVFRNDGGGVFTSVDEPLGSNQGLRLSSIQWGDYDNDGDLDLAVSGEDNINFDHRLIVYRNDGGGDFTQVAEPMGTNLGLNNSSIQWADYDSDGNLDLAVSGQDNNSKQRLIVYRNEGGYASNARPNAPTINAPLGDTVPKGNNVTFDWTGPTTDETPQSALSYNLRVGTQSGTVDVVPADPDGTNEVDGELLGNVQNGDTHPLKTDKLDPGTYYWAVQAVDAGKRRSPWSTEDTFAVISTDPTIDSSTLTASDGKDTLTLSKLDGDTVLHFNQSHKFRTQVVAAETVNLYYRLDGSLASTADTKVSLTNVSANNWNGTIPDTGFSGGDTVNFILEAINFEGNSVIEDSGGIGFRYGVIDRPQPSFDTNTLTVADSNDTLTYGQLGGGQNLHESEDHKFQIFAKNADTVTAFFRRDGVKASTSDSQFSLSIKSSGSGGDTWSGTLTEAQYEPGDTINFVVLARSKSGDTILQDRMGSGYEYTARSDSFTLATRILSNDGLKFSSIQWGDYDNDGDLDLAASGSDESGSNRLIIYRNDGANNFTKVAEPMGAGNGVGASSIQWGDYDRDGDLDLAVSGGDGSNSRLIVFRNDGGGAFTKAVEPMGTNKGLKQRTSIDWGDFDNDGDLDLVASGVDDNFNKRLIVFRNIGGDSFTNAVEPKDPGVRKGSVQWGDYNNDGYLDLAVTGDDGAGGNGRFIIYKNDGSGSFTKVAEPMLSDGGGVVESSVRWGDYNADGKLDLVVSGGDQNNSRRLIVYRNDGGGAFTKVAEPMGSKTGLAVNTSIQWGDYDNDGDLDLVVSGKDNVQTNNRLIVFRNDGGGAFTKVAEPLGKNDGVKESSIQWGDYDSDGTLDLAVSGQINQSFDPENALRVYDNVSGFPSNSRPSAPTINSPTSGDTFLVGDTVTFDWSPASDTETSQSGLTYNLRVGTASGTADIVPADVTSDSEWRSHLGNVQHNDTATLNTSGLSGGTYYWAVQGIDAGYLRSNWSTEQTFELKNP